MKVHASDTFASNIAHVGAGAVTKAPIQNKQNDARSEGSDDFALMLEVD